MYDLEKSDREFRWVVWGIFGLTAVCILGVIVCGAILVANFGDLFLTWICPLVDAWQGKCEAPS